LSRDAIHEEIATFVIEMGVWKRFAARKKALLSSVEVREITVKDFEAHVLFDDGCEARCPQRKTLLERIEELRDQLQHQLLRIRSSCARLPRGKLALLMSQMTFARRLSREGQQPDGMISMVSI
jgi:hypothetical protein